MRIGLVDADSIAYILGWFNKEHKDIDAVLPQVDSFMNSICIQVNATHYMAFLSTRSFRHDVYRFKPYKGNRPPAAEWLEFWKPVINEHLKKKWNARWLDGLEADDLISKAAEGWGEHEEVIICSPDKDMKQIPGDHFDFKENKHCVVTSKEAARNFWNQMLTGDTTDNIAGVPGLGEKKAAPLIWECADDQFLMHTVVLREYRKYFGDFYGQMIFDETRQAVELLCRAHKQNHAFITKLMCVIGQPDKFERVSDIDQELMKTLGWAV